MFVGLVFSADGSAGFVRRVSLYMRHTSGERHLLSSLWISHANIKSVKMDNVMLLGKKQEDHKLRT